MLNRPMLSRRRFLTISAASLAAGRACAAPSCWQGRALGADVTLRLAGAPDPAGRIWRKTARALARVEAQFSLHAQSELTRLNANARLSHPSGAMRMLVDLAGRVHAATGGAFDPSVQPYWLALAQGQDPGRTVTGWDKLRIAPDEIALRPGMALTFNGIAQGFAADTLASLLRAEGYSDVLIDAGEVQALGDKDAHGWQAGIAGPDGTVLRRTTLRDRALATSSPMGTRLMGGQPHILHADGRAPLWSTVSVSARSAALADALSTGFCLMTAPEIAAALRRFPEARLEYLG